MPTNEDLFAIPIEWKAFECNQFVDNVIAVLFAVLTLSGSHCLEFQKPIYEELARPEKDC